jgi:hypothetical protein
MRSLTILASAALLFSRLVSAAPAAQPANLCSQERPLVRALWQQGQFDAPAGVSAAMLDASDGKLPELRQQLAAMRPTEAARWRQVAMLTAAFMGQSKLVEAMLDDGAEVDGRGMLPAFKSSFYRRATHDMAKDSRFGGAAGVKELTAAGVVNNQERPYGPAAFVAIQCGDAATLDVLLRHHVDIAWRLTPHSADALTLATISGQGAIVQRLLDHGADPCFDDHFIRSHRPGSSLASIGRKSGLSEPLVERLTCPAVSQSH